MNKLAEYLAHIYDEDIEIKEVKLDSQLPLFLQNAYEFCEGTIQGHFCLFCQPIDDKSAIRTFTKNYSRIMSYSGKTPVLLVDFLKPNERAFLLKQRLPFVIPFKQMYLPFAGLILTETKSVPKIRPVTFSPSTQCVYLYLFYNDKLVEHTATEIAHKIKYSVMTVSRALRDLDALQLIDIKGAGTKKKFFRIEKRSYLEKGLKHIISPVIKTVYLDKIPQNIKLCAAGESAFAKLSNISEGYYETYAIDKAGYKNLKDVVFGDDGNELERMGVKLEIWSYDPILFAENEVADIVSVYASLKEENDPRIDMAFAEIIGRESSCAD